jgi:hypothetical protein
MILGPILAEGKKQNQQRAEEKPELLKCSPKEGFS